jgi:hypothetical protein
MSRLGDIQQICIIDNQPFASYTEIIDAFKPKNAKRCFISVDKFHGSYKYGSLIKLRTNAFQNITLSINGIQNAYANDPLSKNIVRSNIVDVWMTNSFAEQTDGYYASYLFEATQPNWLEINMADLNNFQLKFQIASTSSDFVNPVSFSLVGQNEFVDFQFYLRLKLRFE